MMAFAVCAPAVAQPVPEGRNIQSIIHHIAVPAGGSFQEGLDLSQEWRERVLNKMPDITQVRYLLDSLSTDTARLLVLYERDPHNQPRGDVPTMPDLIADAWPDTTIRAAFFGNLGRYIDPARNERGRWVEYMPDRPVSLPGTRVQRFRSEQVDQVFELHLAEIGGTDTVGSRPVIVVLDANDDFPLVRALAHRLHQAGHIPDVVIAGIGYPSSPQYFRSRDYTPTVHTGIELPSGGADNFLAFLEQDVLPWIEHEYGASTRYLVGHSLGGLFAIHAAAVRPSLFEGMLISSPSAWWADGEVVRGLSDTEEVPRVFTSIGADETVFMRTAWDTWVQHLQAQGLEHDAVIYEGEDHSTVKAMAYNRGLRKLFEQ